MAFIQSPHQRSNKFSSVAKLESIPYVRARFVSTYRVYRIWVSFSLPQSKQPTSGHTYAKCLLFPAILHVPPERVR